MKFLKDNLGFTLVEMIVVMAILAIMSIIALPKISGILGNERRESSILKAYIEAVTDDSFVNRETNYLCINLSRLGSKNSELFNERFNDTNLVNVYRLENGKFNQSNSKVLKDRQFSSSFTLDEVTLEGGKNISSGNVLIPFYSDGTSESFIIKVISGNTKTLFIKNKINKTVKLENDI